MRNLKLTIEYDGTKYAGWQIQNRNNPLLKKHKTIQEALERSLRKVLREKVTLIVSGRTDSGVHAFGQVANFKTSSKIPLRNLQLAINSSLSPDIKIKKIEKAAPDFHSRFCARGKVYRYYLLNQSCPSVFLKNFVYFYPYPLDVALMRKEAKCLLGKHDFKAFCASGSAIKDTVRTIKRLSVRRLIYNFRPVAYELIIIEIEADGFLYHMVRNIVGTLIEIGRHSPRYANLKKILLSRQRSLSGPTAPAKGLVLAKVSY